MSRIIREAKQTDIADIMKVMEAAKKIMRSSGNMHQWGEGYPSEAVITSDMEKSGGFVIYDGKWLDDDLPYHVVHRIASYPDAHHIFSDMIDFCFAHDANIRIDTHRDNTIMQHNLQKHGFTYCGIIYLASGDERLAYQRITQ